MKLVVYLWLYRWTGDRRWVSRYVCEMNRQIEEDIKKFREEVKHETN